MEQVAGELSRNNVILVGCAITVMFHVYAIICHLLICVLLCFIVFLSLYFAYLSIDLFSSTAARVFNLLTYLLTIVNHSRWKLFVISMHIGRVAAARV